MEDILASIRKIIAQDDSRSKQADAPAHPDAATPRPAAPPAGHGNVLGAHHSPAEPAAPPVATAGGMSAPPMQAAPVHQAAAAQSASPGQPSYRTQTAPRPASTLAALANQVRQEMPRSQPAAPLRAPSPAPSPMASSSPVATLPRTEPSAMAHPAAAQPAVAEKPAPTPHQSAAHPAHAAPSELAAFREALVSPGTSKAVHDSFDRLKAAVADDTAAKVEAVLRPMLREWLDNNLPGLVEKMVREEIERISRR